MSPRPGHLFYDGSCGVCHAAVRLALALDPKGSLRFAPLGGETFERRVAPAARHSLPDSLLVATSEDRLLTRSAAVVHVLRGFGGPWRALAVLAGAVPARLADVLYDAFARRRHLVAGRPAGTCPVVPEPLRARFDP